MLIKRSFSLAGHRTSVALEAEFWAALMDLARHRAITLSALVAETDAARVPDRPLASALRVHALTGALTGILTAPAVPEAPAPNEPPATASGR